MRRAAPHTYRRRRYCVLISNGQLLYFTNETTEELMGSVPVCDVRGISRILEHVNGAPSPYLVK